MLFGLRFVCPSAYEINTAKQLQKHYQQLLSLRFGVWHRLLCTYLKTNARLLHCAPRLALSNVRQAREGRKSIAVSASPADVTQLQAAIFTEVCKGTWTECDGSAGRRIVE